MHIFLCMCVCDRERETERGVVCMLGTYIWGFNFLKLP